MVAYINRTFIKVLSMDKEHVCKDVLKTLFKNPCFLYMC